MSDVKVKVMHTSIMEDGSIHGVVNVTGTDNIAEAVEAIEANDMNEQTDMLRQAYIHMRSAEEADSPDGAIVNTNMAHAYATIAQAEAATRQAEAAERTAESLEAIYKNGI